MKLYCKIKRDGKWNWVSADSPWKQHVARGLCECRRCRPDKPETISQADIDKEIDASPEEASVADLLLQESSTLEVE